MVCGRVATDKDAMITSIRILQCHFASVLTAVTSLQVTYLNKPTVTFGAALFPELPQLPRTMAQHTSEPVTNEGPGKASLQGFGL